MRPLVISCAVLLLGCPSGNSGNDGGTLRPPPQAFLTVTESNVIDTKITGKVSVSGCKAVTQVQLLQQGTFLADLNFTTSPTAFDLPGNLFAGFYHSLGIAAPLTLAAKVICDDGRTNTSTPVGVSFFPVASRFSTGEQVMPDDFVVEGGLGGSAVTFLGCVGTSTGTTLARADLSGNPTYSQALPFACGPNTQISDRSRVTGTRWVLEPGKGAYAINSRLEIVKTVSGSLKRMGVGSNGTGIFWDDTMTSEVLIKAEPVAAVTNDWRVLIPGIMNADPVIDVGGRVVWASMWQFDQGSGVGDIVAFKLNLDNGALVNGIGSGGPPLLIHQNFGSIVNPPITPQGTFNADGSLFFAPLITTDVNGVVRTTVLGCTTAGTCDQSGRRFTSPTFDGVISLVLPFSAGNLLAAVGPFQVWFLEPVGGTVRNLSEAAIRPSGALQVLSVYPGVNTEFYVLTGPVSNNRTFPVEAIAIDRPESGELYRFSFGSGEVPGTAMAMGVDEGGQAWFRVGSDQVKPLPLTTYRSARGTTVIP